MLEIDVIYHKKMNNGTISMEVKSALKPYYATFAYPYMNGPLHLGHLYTTLRYYFRSHYQSMITGCDVFLPYAFHCTGMPIYANAMKLQNDDETVRKILLDTGVKECDIYKFKDPNTWIEYFPVEAARILGKLNLKGFRPDTHFITTNRNPYYDSFVQWQMNTLKKANVCDFADRPAIYSKLDNQPCAAHDRQTGEDAIAVKTCIVLKDSVWIAVVPEEYPKLQITSGNIEWDKSQYKRGDGMISGYLLDNLKLQGIDEGGTEIYLPSEKVVSRSGQSCCVAITGQWYLKYSDPIWKRKVTHYINTQITIHDPVAKQELLAAAENMYDWCISREFGLGTRIPWDIKFNVDSLSDSTAYWGYYTVVQELQKDILGSTPGPSGLIPSQLTEDFWNYIFLRTEVFPEHLTEFTTTIEKMKDMFKFRTPMDLRVSGKDLVHNHLVMALFNGIILGERFMPKEYIIGGYLKLNNKKMSKSTGNYITIGQALDKYPRNGILVSLAEAGDNMTDANIRMDSINQDDKSITKTLRILDKKYIHEKSMPQFDKELYLNSLIDCAHWVTSAYGRGCFAEGLQHGWRRTLKIYEEYQGSFSEIDDYAKDIIRYSLYPIFPEIITGYENAVLTVNIFNEQIIDQDIMSLRFLQKNLQSIWKKCKNKNNITEVSLHERVTEKPHIITHIIEILGQLRTVPFKIIKNTKQIHEKCDPYKIKPCFTL